MTVLARARAAIDRQSDRLNPVVIKEVWQSLRARLFWIPFGLLLAACVGVVVFAFLQYEQGGAPRGREYYLFFLWGLMVVHFLIVPFAAYRSMAREQELETWVLLTITGLGPKPIVRGKIASFLMLAGLYGSVVGPFIVFSYFLEGVDLFTIGTGLLLDVCGLVLLTSFGVAIATAGTHRFGRALWGLVVLLVLLAAVGLGLLLAEELSRGSVSQSEEILLLWTTAIWGALSLSYFAYEASSARLMLASEDRARGPRLAFLLLVVGTSAIAALMWRLLFSGDSEAYGAGFAAVVLLFATLGTLLATERDQEGVIFRHRGLSLLRPGGLNGFRFIVSTFVLLGAAWWLAGVVLEAHAGDRFAIGALAVYTVMYQSLALIIARGPRWKIAAGPAGTRSVFVGLLLLFGVVAPFMIEALDSLSLWTNDDRPERWLALLSPTLGAYVLERSKSSELLVAVVAATAVLVIVADRVLARRHHAAR